MANIKSAIKRIRQNNKQRLHNRYFRATMRTHVKLARQAMEEKDVEKAKQAVQTATDSIQKLGSKNILHAKTAARLVSRLNHQFHKFTQAA